MIVGWVVMGARLGVEVGMSRLTVYCTAKSVTRFPMNGREDGRLFPSPWSTDCFGICH
jgi:hypothetical protein